jgi:[ribosomal protein S18]-alanine N-acetyltransferase
MIVFKHLTELCPQIVEVHGQSFDHGWSATTFQDLLNKPTSRLYVAYEDDTLLGLLLVACISPESEILTIATAPAARRRGIGRGLLDYMRQALSQEGVSEVHLEVAMDNAPAIGLYHSLGFEKVGLRKAYYDRRPAPPVDALVLKLNICAL